jgi:hypothetical protein
VSASNHLLIVNEQHRRGARAAMARHYNKRRPHQGRQQQAPNDTPGRIVHLSAAIRKRQVLGKLINEYHRAA